MTRTAVHAAPAATWSPSRYQRIRRYYWQWGRLAVADYLRVWQWQHLQVRVAANASSSTVTVSARTASASTSIIFKFNFSEHHYRSLRLGPRPDSKS